jgi:Na+/melibiose symporter-like transporter
VEAKTTLTVFERMEIYKLEKKLPGLLVHSYGLSHLTFSLMMSLALQYYMIFLTDVALIKLAHVPVIMFITHIVDAFSIPVSGVLIQRSQFRWGQFRSWLLLPASVLWSKSNLFEPGLHDSSCES